MARRRTPPLADRMLGQHINLTAATHIARTQLVRDPAARYDTEHLFELLDVIARALVKVATLYVREPNAEPRELTAAELEGAKVLEGGNYLILRDGRKVSAVSIKRMDLRQAIAVLRAVGLPELGAEPRRAPPPPGNEGMRDQALELETLEGLLRAPLISPQLERANAILISLARHQNARGVAIIAMQLMSALLESRGQEELDERVPVLLAQLRAAVTEAERAKQAQT